MRSSGVLRRENPRTEKLGEGELPRALSMKSNLDTPGPLEALGKWSGPACRGCEERGVGGVQRGERRGGEKFVGRKGREGGGS